MKSYKKGLIFPVVKTVKIHKSFAKASQGVFTIVNASVYLCFEQSRRARNLFSHQQIMQNLILQTNRLSNSSSA